MNTDMANMREAYDRPPLHAEGMAPEPIAQFEEWFDEARRADISRPNAMTLATTAPNGAPSARTVLLKQVDERGFVFFTNYRSRKARELAANPQAALVFWWSALERQVRVEGRVMRTAEEASDAYFHTRPRRSRLSAWASPQSETVEGRKALEERFAAVAAEYEDREAPRPPHWGGYRLTPHTVEFWQGRPGRLHDRLRYHRTDDDDWQIERLAP